VAIRSSTAATVLGSIRITFGIGALLAPGLSRRAIRLPAAHDNPSARLMVGLFAWREIALGAQVLMVRNDPARLAPLALLDALVDLGDAVSNAVPVIRRQGIDAGAGTMWATALVGSAAWAGLSRIAAAEAAGARGARVENAAAS
jgi:hypothetical protein